MFPVLSYSSNVTLTAETVLIYKIWGIFENLSKSKIEAYLCNKQNKYGGWELFYGDGGEISTSIEAYMAGKNHQTSELE